MTTRKKTKMTMKTPSLEWISERLADFKACRSHRELAAVQSIIEQVLALPATEQEEAFEVWSTEVCKHGPRGAHLNLKALAECLLSELHEARAQAAMHTEEIKRLEFECDAQAAKHAD